MDYVTYIRSMVGTNKIILNAAACILVDNDNRILLQLRGDDHHWGLPGGIMELGETMETTCRREVFEETGLVVEDLEFLGVFHNKNKRWPSGDLAHIICHVFVARRATGELVIDHQETLDLQYFDPHDLPTIDAIDHRQAIARFFGLEEPKL